MKIYLNQKHIMNNLILSKSTRGWNNTLCNMLIKSNIFNVKFIDFPHIRADHARNANWSMMKVNDTTIGLDTWDTLSPTNAYFDNNFFNNKIKIDLLIKIQYHNCNFWKMFTEKTKIPVTAWTVMPCHHFPLEIFKWQNKNHKWIGTVTGKNNRFGRQPWTDWCSKNNDFYSSGEYLVNDTIDNYIERLKECKWGIILKGKKGAEKNRRECEFSSCSMPLALNYDPEYPFPMEPNKHYVKLNSPDDLAKLRDINPKPFVEASKQLYNDHFSPKGMANTLLKIISTIN
jgi:hypothetical protein